MPTYIGTNKIKGAYIGTNKVKSIYVGTNKVYSSGRIPSIYQEVEYIKAAHSNGAYIDLGVYASNNSRVVIGYQTKSAYGKTNTLQIFGATNSTGIYRHLLTCEAAVSGEYTGLFYSTNVAGTAFTNIYYYDWASRVAGSKSELTIIVPEYNNNITTISYGGTYASLAVGNINSTTIPNTLYLLGQNYKGSYRGVGEKIVYYFQYYVNDVAVRDMIPCYRISDGEIGMYDLVSETFFTNAGTGTFAKGADVN